MTQEFGYRPPADVMAQVASFRGTTDYKETIAQEMQVANETIQALKGQFPPGTEISKHNEYPATILAFARQTLTLLSREAEKWYDMPRQPL